MKVLNLGRGQGTECCVVDFAGIRVMLDCSSDISTTFLHSPLPSPLNHSNLNHSIPLIQTSSLGCVSISSIDVVLVTKASSLFSLPILTERFDGLFHGRILVTEPIIFIAKRLLSELVSLIKLSGRPLTQESQVADSYTGSQFQIPTENELISCFGKITSVHFEEEIPINHSILITPHSSGVEIGSAYWTLETASENIALIGDVSVIPSHSLPFNQTSISNCDIAIINSNSNNKQISYDVAMRELITSISSTISIGGSVLIPCTMNGTPLFDILEKLASISVPIFIISQSANDVFRYSTVCSEWLHPSRAEKVFIPTETFLHTQLISNGSLKIFDFADNPQLGNVFREPCIVFASHSSCRLGDSVHFIQLFGSNSKNLIAFIDPSYNYSSDISTILDPFLPLSCKIHAFPIDIRASPTKILEILSSSQINTVINCGTNLISSTPTTSTLEIRNANYLTTITVRLKRKYIRATIDVNLARNITTKPIGKGIQVGNINCIAQPIRPEQNETSSYILSATIQQQNQSQQQQNQSPLQGKAWGSPDIICVIEAFTKRGIKIIEPVGNESVNGRVVLKVEGFNSKAIVTISQRETSIISNSDQFQQLLLTALSTDCLRSFS